MRLKIKNNKKGMEMVQVAILVAIAIGLGLIFKERIGELMPWNQYSCLLL
jgi:hypothetical protein